MASINKILIVALLFLSGCLGQSHLNSVMEFEETGRAQIIAEFAGAAVTKFALNNGGVCPPREQGVYCSLNLSTISSGIRQNGNAFFSIRTNRTHWLWATKKGMEEGRYIYDFHKELERWATDAFAEFQPQTRTRSYSGYGVIGSF